MRVLFKKTAIDDIKASADYIAENLHNKASAKKLSESIYRTAMMLSDSPYLGARLSGKYDVETDLERVPRTDRRTISDLLPRCERRAH